MPLGIGSSPETPQTSWCDCFVRMLGRVLQDGLDLNVDLGQPYEALYQQLERHMGVLDVVQTPRLVHWDLWDGNIFVDPKSGQITGLIDFERVMWADPLMEAVFGKPVATSAFAEGFGGGVFQDSQQVTRRRLYNVYLDLIMIIECYFRKYPTHNQENWARGLLQEELQRLGEI